MGNDVGVVNFQSDRVAGLYAVLQTEGKAHQLQIVSADSFRIHAGDPRNEVRLTGAVLPVGDSCGRFAHGAYLVCVVGYGISRKVGNVFARRKDAHREFTSGEDLS